MLLTLQIPLLPVPSHQAVKEHQVRADNFKIIIIIITIIMGARGSVVVKALCYKPEGRGFETR
jgi:hypothetical protein